MNKSTTIARMRGNGGLVRIKPDGTEEALDTPPLAPLSAAEIEAAAVRDHENPPLTDARPGQLRSVPRVKTLRRALALTQEEFAVRYHIPFGTLAGCRRAASNAPHESGNKASLSTRNGRPSPASHGEGE